ncbi:MAG: glutamyl-tRNA reductase [Erysipelotrichaceae bacterium]|nr:glutamyl-tRNA reductase [Erysipelotrichaceae bacterium]
MNFIMMGISYEETSMNDLNQIFLSDTNMMEIYLKLQDININQAVILSTCNRKEIYYMSETEHVNQVLDILSSYMNDISLHIRKDNEAYEYLFEVTSGLHSMVLGEDQILGQVVDAMEFSKRCGCLKKEMAKVFREAITCAKEIKRDIHISEHPLSLSYIAIKELRQHISLKGKNALIIGSGKMATLALTYLVDENMNNITICNRSVDHAKKLKQQYPSIDIKDYHQRYDILQHCDVLISATSSPHLVIEEDKVNIDHDIYMIDLALPNDIDEKLINHEHVFLLNMSYLKKVSHENEEKRKQCINDSKATIEHYLEELYHWFENEKVDESLMLLQQYYQQVIDDTDAILEKKLNLDEHEKYVLKKTLHIMHMRLLKQPIQVLKHLDEDKQDLYNQVIDALFQIEGEK